MPVRAYTFKVELLDSHDPVITRTFTIPASWTFYKLHAAIQYTFGWQDCHLHFFTFEQATLGRGPALLRIESGDSEEYGDFNVGGGTSVIDTKIRLSDVWEERGKYRRAASHNGTLGTCCYLYDFGDNWEHQVDFVSRTTLDSKELKVIEVQGAGPMEDSGGIYGWEAVKNAFAATNPSRAQIDRRNWATEGSSSYDPTIAPTVASLNSPGTFELWLDNAAIESEGSFSDLDSSDELEGDGGRTETETRLPEPGPYPAMPQPQVTVFTSTFGPPIQCTAEQRQFKTHSPDTHPLDLFTPAINLCSIPAPRFVHTDNTHMASILIFTDGAAVNESTPDQRAGFGLYFVPGTRGFGQAVENVPGHIRNTNRAELRAALAGLTIRFWPGEGFRRVVIGASSEYVVKGVCEWSETWRQRGWRTSRGTAVTNRDLWEMLFARIDEFEEMGIKVQFYLLKSRWNKEAADRAMEAALESTDVPSQVTGVAYFDL